MECNRVFLITQRALKSLNRPSIQSKRLVDFPSKKEYHHKKVFFELLFLLALLKTSEKHMLLENERKECVVCP